MNMLNKDIKLDVVLPKKCLYIWAYICSLTLFVYISMSPETLSKPTHPTIFSIDC